MKANSLEKAAEVELVTSPFCELGDERYRAVRVHNPGQYVVYDIQTREYIVSPSLTGSGGLLVSYFKRFVSNDRLWYSDRVEGKSYSRKRNPKITMWKELQRLIKTPSLYHFLVSGGARGAGGPVGPVGPGRPGGLGGARGVTLLRSSPIPNIVPKIYLSGAEFAQDTQWGPDRWRELEIGCIINTTDNDPPSSYLLEVYESLDMKCISIPISDSTVIPPPEYLQRIVKQVRELPFNSGNILIHCSAGINRSAYVAATVLWFTTPNAQTYWPKAEELIEYMRTRQRQDRGQVMLFNRAFYDDLCKKLTV